ncbi:hypothetical protein ACIQWI_24895 [Peribacillus frigoritolerans]
MIIYSALVNIVILIMLYIIYSIVERTQRKSMFYNPMLRKAFIFYIAPISVFILNLVLSFIFQIPNYLFLSFLTLLVPIFNFLFRILRRIIDNNRYKALLKSIQPVVISVLEEQNIKISKEDIRLIYYHQFKERHLDIRIEVSSEHKELIKIGKKLERKVKYQNITSGIVTSIFFEKKSDLFKFSFMTE